MPLPIRSAFCILLYLVGFSFSFHAYATCTPRVFSANESQVLAIYQAFYGRPADPAGLTYWVNRLEGEGGQLEAILDAFANSNEYSTRFGAFDNEQLVINLYDQLFGRQPDIPGLNFYTSELESGHRTLVSIALDILNGAQHDDATLIQNRLQVAGHYVTHAEMGHLPDDASATELASLTQNITLDAQSAASICEDMATALASNPSVQLTLAQTHSLNSGTHRPEILFDEDRNQLILTVVEHELVGNTQLRHKGYLFDLSRNPLHITPDNAAGIFPVSEVTETYGEGADHRTLIMGDELVVVYQTNLRDPDRVPPVGDSGPSEQYSLAQSLMLSRFSAEDGSLIYNTAIAPNVTDFTEDNFPDMAITTDPTSTGRILINTGSQGPGNLLTLRSVGLDGTLYQSRQYTASTQGIPQGIGNSLVWGQDGWLRVFSYAGPAGQSDLVITTLDASWNPGAAQTLSNPEREEIFPTGVLYHAGYYFVAYIYRQAGTTSSLSESPYFPALRVLDANFDTVLQKDISDDSPGFSHVHPTVAIVNDQLFYAWSSNDNGAPKVRIEQFSLQTHSH